MKWLRQLFSRERIYRPHLLYVPLRRVATDAVLDAAKMLDEFPYSRYLSAARRRLILKVLRIRADKLMDIAQAL
jgi:hypothetical protein